MAAAAMALPVLMAHNVSPSPTFLNQALALAIWGLFGAFAARAPRGFRPGAAEGALGLLLFAVGLAWGQGDLPSTLALSALGMLLAATFMLMAGRSTSGPESGASAMVVFCAGLALAAIASLGVAVLQVFAPSWTDGRWIATSGIPGRAVGNLRQPNHLSSVLMWGCIATVVLMQLKRLPWRVGAALLAAMVFGVVLTASRTGLLSVLLLALWGLADRRAPRALRGLLLATPLMYAVGWWAMAQWAAATQQAFGGAARLAETDISGSRFAIWADALTLIRAHPWTGVGWGEFNLAWTLSPLPGRPTAFFDHAHNLPLHLAVELGLPLAALVLALLLGSYGFAAWRAWRTDGDDGIARRGAVLVVTMIGLHSLLEYPLWYAYFLLPTAWAWGVALRPVAQSITLPTPEPVGASIGARGLRAGAVLMLVGAVFAVWDYHRVVEIFRAAPGAPPLQQRIETGQRSVFFGHHADYAAVTSGIPIADPEAAFERASHFLLDTRFMIAWARQRAASGREAEARHLADRLREFRRPESEGFFAPCANPASAAMAFQCQPSGPVLTWQDVSGGSRPR